MIIQRYNYTPLDRTTIEGKRHYCLPDGSKVPSVTTILDKTKPAEAREALQNWRKAVGEERAQQITTEAANRGTRMHAYLEHYVKTGELGFKAQELKHAIRAATRAENPSKLRINEDSVNPVCFAFVRSFLAGWDEAKSFSAKELNLIFTKLYAAVLIKYENTSKHGAPFLKIENKELKQAVESALACQCFAAVARIQSRVSIWIGLPHKHSQ